MFTFVAIYKQIRLFKTESEKKIGQFKPPQILALGIFCLLKKLLRKKLKQFDREGLDSVSKIKSQLIYTKIWKRPRLPN